MTDKQAKSAAPFSKDWLLFVPLLGSALALIYDSGYFNGLGGHYFTLFSINEHIAFALEVLPVALGTAILGSLYFVWRARDMTERLKRLNRHPMLTTAVFALAGLGLFLFLRKIVGTYVSVASLAAAMAVFVGFLPGRALWRAMLAAVFLIATVFSFGHEVAAVDTDSDQSPAITNLRNWLPHVRATTTLNTTDGQRIEARVLRSGERGVLYFDLSSRQITLLSWSLILKISTVR